MGKAAKRTQSKTAWDYKVTPAGEKVKPAFYNGASAGHGKYMAAQGENGSLITKDDIPIPYREI